MSPRRCYGACLRWDFEAAWLLVYGFHGFETHSPRPWKCCVYMGESFLSYDFWDVFGRAWAMRSMGIGVNIASISTVEDSPGACVYMGKAFGRTTSSTS